jgi:hypothetical protein
MTINYTTADGVTGAITVELVGQTEGATGTATPTSTSVPEEAEASLSPETIPFGDQRVGTTSTDATITLTNTGGAPLDLAGVTLAGPQSSVFLLGSNTCEGTLAPGASCTVKAAFAPTGPGTATADVQFTDNAPNSPQSVALSGVGTIPPSVSGDSVDFGTQPVETTSGVLTVTVTNVGDVALGIDGVAINGTDADAFSLVSNTCMGTLDPGASCQIQLTFHPPATGDFSATLSFSTTPQANGLHALALSGIGI